MQYQNKSIFKLRQSILVASVLAALAAGTVHAQSTTGNLYGVAPVAAGETVMVKNNAGFSREVQVGENGRYSIDSIPVGDYTVTLRQNGQPVDTRVATLLAGAGTEVSFAAATSSQSLGTVSVTANSVPAIDVTAVDSRTVITTAQLDRLPIARNAESIALLAPGVNVGSAYFTGTTFGNALISIGGSSVSENAYYIDGFNTTDPIQNFGGITLPYGAISQEQVLTGGYGPDYGRSDGGVISQVGKSGSNDWHFGAAVNWQPASLQSNPINWYYAQNTSSAAGKLYAERSADNSWDEVIDAYVGGPIIKDKLFFFAAAEWEKGESNAVSSNSSNATNQYTHTLSPKEYFKLNWNITDNQTLEYTYVENKQQNSGFYNNYNYTTLSDAGFNSLATATKNSAADNILNYKGYFTDNLTVSFLYGKQAITYYNQIPGYNPGVTYVASPDQENPALTGGNIYNSSQVVATLADPAHRAHDTNLRFKVDYKLDLTAHSLGTHTLSAGIDNQRDVDTNDSTITSGPGGYQWTYQSHDPTTPISDAPFVDATGNYPGGSTGYFVTKDIFDQGGTVQVKQTAQFIQDSWQVSDRWLVNLGLRNDQFTNYNNLGQPYLRLTKPQWAPRLGFSWDTFGDSSMKIYGNAGRYYLSLPPQTALRGADGSTLTSTYYTYTGIDPATGYPTGLTPINTVNGPGQPVSPNGEYGQPLDPHSITSVNAQAEHQDEFVLGLDKQLNDTWTFGAKGIFRKLVTGLDDICDYTSILAAAQAKGFTTAQLSNFCYLSNPGKTNIYALINPAGGYYNVPVTAADLGGMAAMKRNYYALNLSLEHPFDGKWQGRIDYVFSRSYGNSEGQVRSDIGQGGGSNPVSATVDFDFWQFEQFAEGDLENDHTHELKAYGSYQLTPQWMISGVADITSGSPRSCLGYFGPNQTNPTGYGPYYHWCDGVPSPPGAAGRNPMTEIVSLGLQYRPDFADHKLGFSIYVFNLFNQQKVTQTYPIYGQAGSVVSAYGLPLSSNPPRYIRFGATYDF